MTVRARPRAHEIDTRATQRVQLALPAAWVPRLTTERDYGVDMLVELFDDGRPSGGSLLLQIKGKDEGWPTPETITIQVPVRMVRYAELWIAPVLLVVCPIRNEPSTFGYLWLQEYVRVVLEHDRPNWRRQASVTVHLPAGNRLPGQEGTLAWISDHPARIEALGQLARIEHELGYGVDEVAFEVEPDRVLSRMSDLFHDAEPHARTLSRHGGSTLAFSIVASALAAIELLRRGRPPTRHDLESLGMTITAREIVDTDPALRSWMLRDHVRTSAHRLGTIVAIAFDHGIRRRNWEVARDHLF